MTKKQEVYHEPEVQLDMALGTILGLEEGGRVWHELMKIYPDLKSKDRCANCNASMLEYMFSFDILDAILLYAMAQRVQVSVRKGDDFTKANAIHVPTIGDISLAVRCRTTQCSKLGLIAKLKNAKGKHVSGMWVITSRGWAALAGRPVPRRVRVFRGEIQERFGDEVITIQDAFMSHRTTVKELMDARKDPKNDYRMYIADYNHNDWVEYAGVQEGKLF